MDFSNVQFVIKFMEEFNKMATDRQYIDCYGFIDRDFYHDISKIKQINKTTEHDSETNLIRCCMPQYLNLDKVHDYKQAAIGVFCKVFRFCVNQGILEKTSFDYETQYENSGGFDEDKMGEIIWLSHSYFKDNCGSDSFVDKDFDKYIRDNSNCFDKDFVEIYQKNKDSLKNRDGKSYLSFIDEYCWKWLDGKSGVLEKFEENTLDKLLQYCNGHIFLNQLIVASRPGEYFNFNYRGTLDEKPFDERDFTEKLTELALQNIQKMSELMPLKEYIKFRERNNYLCSKITDKK